MQSRYLSHLFEEDFLVVISGKSYVQLLLFYFPFAESKTASVVLNQFTKAFALLPRIQVHARINEAEDKVHALKLIQIYHLGDKNNYCALCISACENL